MTHPKWPRVARVGRVKFWIGTIHKSLSVALWCSSVCLRQTKILSTFEGGCFPAPTLKLSFFRLSKRHNKWRIKAQNKCLQIVIRSTADGVSFFNYGSVVIGTIQNPIKQKEITLWRTTQRCRVGSA